MKMNSTPQHPVYSNHVIEFITVAAEYCSFMEQCNQLTALEFTEKTTKILPLLYLKSSLLPVFEPVSDENTERFVTEEHYEYIRQQILKIIGRYDEYLEVFHPDMKYSESPVLASISEDLTDIYQDLKDMISNFQSADLQIMNDCLSLCKENFKEFWGQKCLNALRALHNVLYSGAALDEEEITDYPYESPEELLYT
jgi:hypothetical protein